MEERKNAAPQADGNQLPEARTESAQNSIPVVPNLVSDENVTVADLRRQLEQSNKSKERLWNNLLILKEKIIDTSKLIELYWQEQEARRRLERARKEGIRLPFVILC